MSKPKIGWIGTGVMGNAMCGHLLEKGYPVTLHTRTKKRAENLLDAGASWAETPGDAAEEGEIIFTIVGYPGELREVIFAPGGVMSRLKSGSVIVDMTTSRPSLAREIAGAAEKKGASALDAPVSGGDTGARNGTLAIMAGGNRETFQQVLPLFEIIGGNIKYLGPPGSGQHTKMSNQILIASTMIGVVESLIYAVKAGLDPEEVMSVVGKGAAASWSYNNLGPRILKNDFAPGFYIKHFIKDMGIALEEARRMKLALPGLALAHQFYIGATAHGLENLGTQGLYKVIEAMNRNPDL